jgi:hypothetical protein
VGRRITNAEIAALTIAIERNLMNFLLIIMIDPNRGLAPIGYLEKFNAKRLRQP